MNTREGHKKFNIIVVILIILILIAAGTLAFLLFFRPESETPDPTTDINEEQASSYTEYRDKDRTSSEEINKLYEEKGAEAASAEIDARIEQETDQSAKADLTLQSVSYRMGHDQLSVEDGKKELDSIDESALSDAQKVKLDRLYLYIYTQLGDEELIEEYDKKISENPANAYMGYGGGK